MRSPHSATRRTASRWAVAVFLLPLALPASAQDAGPISTDRPGFAFNPTTVPAGAFQVEVGTPQLTRVSGGGATTSLYSIPTGLRYGVIPRLEVRVNSSVFNAVSVDLDAGNDPDGASGFGDIELGLKYQVLEARGSTPGLSLTSLSLIPSVVIPTGEDGFTVGDAVVNLNASAGFALPSGLGATFVAGATIPTADGTRANATLVALLGRSFSPALSGYVEAAAFPTDGATPLYAGAGIAYLLTSTVQLDAFFDAGLNDEAVDLIGGLGVSIRFGR